MMQEDVPKKCNLWSRGKKNKINFRDLVEPKVDVDLGFESLKVIYMSQKRRRDKRIPVSKSYRDKGVGEAFIHLIANGYCWIEMCVFRSNEAVF